MKLSVRNVCVSIGALALGVLLLNFPFGKTTDIGDAGLDADLQPKAQRTSDGSSRAHLEADSTSQREAIASEVPPTDIDSSAPPADVSELSSAANEAARALRAENLERRRVQIKEQIENRAVRIANALVLATGAEQKIAGVFLEEQAKLDAIRAEFTEGDRSRESRDKMRVAMEQIPVWREKRLTTLFGPQIAQKIVNFDDAATLQELETKPKQPKD